MKTRKIGELEVSMIGLGCMGMSEFYGTADEAEAIKTIHHALDNGINFLDTAEIYGPYKNEELLGKFLTRVSRNSVVVATKFGFRFDADGIRSLDSSPQNIRRACDGSLARRDSIRCRTHRSVWSKATMAPL